MFKIFTFNPYLGSREAFGGQVFPSYDAIQESLADLIVHFEIDPDSDGRAADFITRSGDVYAVEMIA